MTEIQSPYGFILSDVCVQGDWIPIKVQYSGRPGDFRGR